MNKTISIQNLKCGGCKTQIETEISKIEGVIMVQVDEEDQEISLSLEPYPGIEERIIQSLKKMGYPPISDSNSLLLKSKSYLSCALGKTKKLL